MISRLIPRFVLGLIALGALAIGLTSGRASTAAGTSLVGTFKIARGTCTGGAPGGSYFRMVYPGGTIKAGRFFQNPDSTCADKSYTPVGPGSGGGLVTGGFQPHPTPAFDAKGNSLARKIIATQRFTAIAFGLSTDPRDPQGSKTVPPPTIQAASGKLSGQVEALVASWNKLYFNQGSPKPGGAKPGLTSAVSGTYDSGTGAYTLVWASAVVGGPFNGFTGYWHLQGTFVPRS
jgi:hypothetical protein